MFPLFLYESGFPGFEDLQDGLTAKEAKLAVQV
jgi:hypothetical protein